MMRIYLASSWRNKNQPAVLKTLRDAGHYVYDFRNPDGDTGFSWSKITDKPIDTTEAMLRVLSHPIAQKGFNSDFDAMKWADMCVLLLPCGRSAHLESGWFSGKGKPVAVLARDIEEPELMYKCFDNAINETPIFSDDLALLDHIERISHGTS